MTRTVKSILFTAFAARTGSPATPLVPLSSLIDRPFLQHLAEVLVEAGIKEIHVVSERHPEQIEELLGDGTRWGVKIRHHLTDPDQAPYASLKTLIDLPRRDLVLLADASCIVPREALQGSLEADEHQLFCDRALGGTAPGWTGWALLPSESLRAHANCRTPDELFARLKTDACFSGHLAEVSSFSAATQEHLLAANRRVLESEAPSLQLLGRTDPSGVRLGRNVRVHPQARLVPPVFLGPDVEVAAECVIGPFAVVGEGAIVDTGTTITNSVVEPNLYVGRGLELNSHHLLDGVLHDTKATVDISISDAVLADTLSRPWVKDLALSTLGRLFALLVLAVTSPLLSILAIAAVLGQTPLFAASEFVRTPHRGGSSLWKTVWLHHFSPPSAALLDRVLGAGSRYAALVERLVCGAVDCMLGRCRWVGVRRRTHREMSEIRGEDRELLLSAWAGVFTEADRIERTLASRNETIADLEVLRLADIQYLGHKSFGGDIKLIAHCLRHPAAIPRNAPAKIAAHLPVSMS